MIALAGWVQRTLLLGSLNRFKTLDRCPLRDVSDASLLQPCQLTSCAHLVSFGFVNVPMLHRVVWTFRVGLWGGCDPISLTWTCSWNTILGVIPCAW